MSVVWILLYAPHFTKTTVHFCHTSHVTARHGVEQSTKANLINYGSIPLIFLGGLGGYIVQQVAGLAIPLGFLKFSRGAEKEAGRLGAQYLWAAGYDPQAMLTFFEKLQAREKKKLGAIANIFMRHPATGDRVTEVRTLITRFPDKAEYEISGTEFKDVKACLLSINTARRGTATPDHRPTLKRRPPAASIDTTTDQQSSGRRLSAANLHRSRRGCLRRHS